MDIQANSEGVSQAESNEQQRKWDEKQWRNKAADSLSNYDPTRTHLNFEVVRGGIVQPIDTSKSIAQKIAENLAARGIKDPNARHNVKRRQNTLAQFIFGGNRKRMHELAFGAQQVDLSKGADNSHITRNKDIELWAKDVYRFVANKFGEDNIVSFYVHCDEKNPHVHCSVLPVDKETSRISWRAVFGTNKYEMGTFYNRLHDDFEREVSRKWGLERGSNMAETAAKHRSTEEYKRDLVNEVAALETTREGLQKQIHRLEIKLKGLSTMIANLHSRREEVQEQIDQIARQFGQEGADTTELAASMARLRKELEEIDTKLALRNKMLEEANDSLAAAKTKLTTMMQEHNRLQSFIQKEGNIESAIQQRDLLAAYSTMVDSSLQPLLPTLTDRQQEILEQSGYKDLTSHGFDIINCALLLATNYVHEATMYAASHGGGGSSPGTGWGKDKDEDDERWWRRCIATAASIMRPAGRKIKRGR